MHISQDPDDRRVEQRKHVRREINRLITELQRDIDGHLVVRGLATAARALHERLEAADREPNVVPHGERQRRFHPLDREDAR